MNSSRKYQLGLIAVVVLVVLRLGIGWHFYREGATKVRQGNFSSAGFLSAARGPLAPTFQVMIWDADGRLRLDYDQTRSSWEAYRQQLMGHYGFTEEQQKQAEDIWQQRDRQLRVFFEANAEDISEYLGSLDRREEILTDAARQEIASLSGQTERFQQELMQKRGPLLTQLDKLWGSYERDLQRLATEEQLKQAGALELRRPNQPWIDTDVVDRVIPWFDLIVGACLILGLVTRVAAVLGGLFLLSVIATQPPWLPGATPVYYQIVEMLSLFALAAVGAGRFAGLDGIIHAIRMRWFPPNRTGN